MRDRSTRLRGADADPGADDPVAARGAGAYSTLLAFLGDEVVGYATVATEGLAWTRHIAELRVLVAEEMRGKQLGRLLTQHAFGLARQRGLQKMVARMTTDQAAAIKVFGKLGFRKEAVLSSYVIDRRGCRTICRS